MSAIPLDRALTRILCHMLRHDPSSYGVIVDQQGWADVDAVLKAVTEKLGRLCAWRKPTIKDLAKVTESACPRRFQLNGRRMRALYGHSLHLVETGVQRLPPPQLFHGTCRGALNVIRQVGLIPATRRYVHLTSNFDYASRVGSRFASAVVLTVLSAAAADRGIIFRQANSQVWLSPPIPPEFIRDATSCNFN